ncbi:DUF502 domain-containing protein [candidate division KSB1 bacterium]|nr:DUF502 domain-containing protein [candidate division KSB1 bacterium]
MFSEVRKTFAAGLLVAIPISLTIFIFVKLFSWIDERLGEPVTHFLNLQFGITGLNDPIPGFGILVLVLLLFLAGLFARNYVGGKLIELGDHIVTQIPIISRIYIAIREISEAIFSEKREVFRKAILIEYPRKGVHSIAFFTQDTRGPVQDALDSDVVSVFVPTTPIPTSGYLLFVPKDQILELDMSVEDALKLVISGGSIHLKNKRDFVSLSDRYLKKGKRKKIQTDNQDHSSTAS